MIAGAAILALCTAGGAIAHGLVTSRDIKDETIAKRDIGPGAVGSREVVDGSLDITDLNDTTQDEVNATSGLIYVNRILSTTSEQGSYEAARCPPETQVITGFVLPGRHTAGFALGTDYVDPARNAWMLNIDASGPDPEDSIRVRVVCLAQLHEGTSRELEQP